MMMPYGSSSSTTVSHAYDVFMSFKGEDTRMSFTSHLYNALTQNGISTYKDDKTLEIGKPIASELLEAIETSRMAIVVLSSNFATSKWCLEEIANIVDCMKRGKLIVIPVFYHVAPTDVRHQSNSFVHAFSNHDYDTEIAPQRVEKWRAAFREVGAISGIHVTEHREEAEVVSEIVSKISRYLPDTMPLDLLNNLVGIESRVDEVKTRLRMESSEVLLIGICGMSGIGKTTLAEAVYKDIKNKFEKGSIIENIKDISKQNDSTDLCKLQQKLLDDILMENNIRVRSVVHGQTLLGTKLCAKKVILVLDDVNHVDQLTYLAGGLEWFGPGSRIIVTTTNRALLNYYKMHEIYLCEEMNGDEALSLFCQSAFKQSRPTHGYEKLSDDIVKLAGGLPLALNVYGSLLCGKEENYWEDMLKKLKEYPEKEVLGRLEVIYARLDKNQRFVFVYVACFLKGRNKDLVNDILTSIGLHAECGITDLINKCLISINVEDNVWMHDLLQQMCWEILRKETHTQIAIKYHKDIVATLSSKPKELPNLRSINLSFSKNLSKIPDLTSASKLMKLNLEGCTNLTSLHASVLLLKRLRYLNLKGCTCLESLGRTPMEMESLEALLLSGCSKLKYIPEFGKNMKRLEHLYVDGTRIKKLPESLGQMYDLRKLDASGTFIEELASFIYRLKKLRLLHVNRCPLSFKTGCFLNPSLKLDTLSSGLKEVDLSYCNISVVPDCIGLLCHLRTLDLSGNGFVSLPASIGLLSKLRMLCLNNCKRLQSLPKLSLVDEDMDYGPRSRFNYYVSAEWVDVSKFHASRYNNHPTVSCLECPKLAVDKRGSYLAEKILNSYLELRTKYWLTPEAVFEIVGAGSEIPSRFVQPDCGGLILEGPWVGVAICAVVSVHHVDVYMESKYMVTAHIHLGEKNWKIPVPIHFLVAESETQLVFYWTVVDDLHRIVGSNQKSNFNVSFSVEPEDSNVQVTKFGARFIRKEYIWYLKQHQHSMTRVGNPMIGISNLDLEKHKLCLEACKDYTYMDHHIHKIVDFIFDHGRQQGSLDAIYQITKGLLEINEEYIAYLHDYCSYSYYVISLVAAALYNDFIRSVKDINAGWLSVKLALEHILVKTRAESYSYKEMLQQIDDLEAAKSVVFSDNFMCMLESIFIRTLDIMNSFSRAFSAHYYMVSSVEKVVAKLVIIITGVLCTMATYMGDFGLLEAMKQMSMSSLFLHLIQAFNDKIQVKDGQFTMKAHLHMSLYCELQISDFYDNGILLRELMNKMARSGCFTKENEEEMNNVIDKLEKNIHKVSSTIQEMSSHADQYSHDLRKVKKHIRSFSKFSKDDHIIRMLGVKLPEPSKQPIIVVHLTSPRRTRR